MKDIFTAKLFNYGSLQLFADTETQVARLQLSDSSYKLPIVADVDKRIAFDVYNNAAVFTFAEMGTKLAKMGGR